MTWTRIKEGDLFGSSLFGVGTSGKKRVTQFVARKGRRK